MNATKKRKQQNKPEKPAAPPKEAAKREPVEKETIPESIAGFAAVFVSGLFIITFVLQLFSIPSSSMERTLLIGDHIFVDRLTPGAKAGYIGPLMPYRPIRRGDIAVLMSPVQPDLHLVKRIVAVPGDRIHLTHGVLYLNGVAQNEPYVIHSRHDYFPYRDEFPSVSAEDVPEVAPDWPRVVRENLQGQDLVVPPGHYFGMGDNREVSLDSRYWGFIPQENIIGRPLFNLWSFDAAEDQMMATSLADRARFVGYAMLHVFDKTRWRRTLKLVR